MGSNWAVVIEHGGWLSFKKKKRGGMFYVVGCKAAFPAQGKHVLQDITYTGWEVFQDLVGDAIITRGGVVAQARNAVVKGASVDLGEHVAIGQPTFMQMEASFVPREIVSKEFGHFGRH